MIPEMKFEHFTSPNCISKPLRRLQHVRETHLDASRYEFGDFRSWEAKSSSPMVSGDIAHALFSESAFTPHGPGSASRHSAVHQSKHVHRGHNREQFALERFSQSCRALTSRHSVFHQVKPFRRGHMIDQTGLKWLQFEVISTAVSTI